MLTDRPSLRPKVGQKVVYVVEHPRLLMRPTEYKGQVSRVISADEIEITFRWSSLGSKRFFRRPDRLWRRAHVTNGRLLFEIGETND
jgi:hypothetical protein